MDGVLDVTAEGWIQEIEQHDTLVVVDFWHERCVWCLRLNPVFAEVAVEYEDRVKFAAINVLASDENQQLAIKYGIMGTPTLVFFCDGKPVETVAGFQSKDRLKQLVDDVLVNHRKCVEKSTQFTP
jgi:thioredoxin 1